MQSSGGDDVRRDRCDHVSPLFTKVIAVGWGAARETSWERQGLPVSSTVPPTPGAGSDMGWACGTYLRNEETGAQRDNKLSAFPSARGIQGLVEAF